MTALALPARFLHIVEALLWVPSRFMRKFIAGPPTPAALHGVSTLHLSSPYLQYDSNGTFHNVPLLLSHACPCAGWFDAYICSTPSFSFHKFRLCRLSFTESQQSLFMLTIYTGLKTIQPANYSLRQ